MFRMAEFVLNMGRRRRFAVTRVVQKLLTREASVLGMVPKSRPAAMTDVQIKFRIEEFAIDMGQRN